MIFPWGSSWHLLPTCTRVRWELGLSPATYVSQLVDTETRTSQVMTDGCFNYEQLRCGVGYGRGAVGHSYPFFNMTLLECGRMEGSLVSVAVSQTANKIIHSQWLPLLQQKPRQAQQVPCSGSHKAQGMVAAGLGSHLEAWEKNPVSYCPDTGVTLPLCPPASVALWLPFPPVRVTVLAGGFLGRGCFRCLWFFSNPRFTLKHHQLSPAIFWKGRHVPPAPFPAPLWGHSNRPATFGCSR